MIDQPSPPGSDRPVERAAPERADTSEPEEGDGVEDPVDSLRRSTARVRRNGKRLSHVHEQLQSTASRVQALRETTRTLGEEIARTRDAVDHGPGVE